MTDSKDQKGPKIGRVWAPVPTRKKRKKGIEESDDSHSSPLDDDDDTAYMRPSIALSDDLETEFHDQVEKTGVTPPPKPTNLNVSSSIFQAQDTVEDLSIQLGDGPTRLHQKSDPTGLHRDDGPTRLHQDLDELIVHSPSLADEDDLITTDVADATTGPHTPAELHVHTPSLADEDDLITTDVSDSATAPHAPVAEDPTALHSIQIQESGPVISQPTGQQKSPHAGHSPFQYSPSQPPNAFIGSPLEIKKTPTRVPLAADGTASASTALYQQLDDVAILGKLVLLRGAGKQPKEVLLVEPMAILGREKGNAIVVPDPLVSRQHLKIYRKKTGYDIETIGENGTLLNSKPITQRTPIREGDTIQVGNSIYQFEHVEQDIKTLPLFQIIVTAVLIAAVVLFSIIYFIPTQNNHYSHLQKDTQKHIALGLKHFQKARWTQAIFEFKLAQKKSPNSPQINSLLHDALKEARVSMLVRKAQLLFSKRRWSECFRTLRTAETHMSPGSVNAEALWRLMIGVKHKLKKDIVPQKIPPETKNHAVLPAKSPPAKRTKKTKKQPAPAPIPATEPPQGSPKASPPPSKDKVARQTYNAGDIKRARKLFEEVKFAEDLKRLKEFSIHFREGRIAHNTRNSSVAIPLLAKALQLDKEIGGGESVFSFQIKAMLANMYAFQGLHAVIRKQSKVALQNFRKALRYNPKHALSKTQIARLAPKKGQKK